MDENAKSPVNNATVGNHRIMVSTLAGIDSYTSATRTIEKIFKDFDKTKFSYLSSTFRPTGKRKLLKQSVRISADGPRNPQRFRVLNRSFLKYKIFFDFRINIITKYAYYNEIKLNSVIDNILHYLL